MGNEELDEEAKRTARRSVGPIVMLLPLAFSLLAFAFLKKPISSQLRPRARPPEHQLDGRVDGWQGELALANGLRWSATLKPLHGDATWQAYDSKVLKQRFGLETGQVYRLSLAEVSNNSSSELLELPLNPEDLTVADSEGNALSILVPNDGGIPADPLRVLFAPPAQNLKAERAASWILWGRAPGANARVSGFDGERQLPLEARSFPREQVDVALVRRTQ